MKHVVRLLALLASLWVPTLSRATAPIEGVYVSEDQDHAIELYCRDAFLYGRIVWTRPADLRDTRNPDPRLRTRKVAGIEHLRKLRAEGAAWLGGELYNPEDGRTYDVKLWHSDHNIIVRGSPRIAALGGLLGALFGRIHYQRLQGGPR